MRKRLIRKRLFREAKQVSQQMNVPLKELLESAVEQKLADLSAVREQTNEVASIFYTLCRQHGSIVKRFHNTVKEKMSIEAELMDLFMGPIPLNYFDSKVLACANSAFQHKEFEQIFINSVKSIAMKKPHIVAGLLETAGDTDGPGDLICLLGGMLSYHCERQFADSCK